MIEKKSEEKDYRYQVKTINGVLDNYFRKCDLGKCNGLVEIDKNKTNTIT